MSIQSPSKEEDRYFQVQEAHRRELLRIQLENEAARLRVVLGVEAQIGIEDAALAERLRGLGLDAETAVVVYYLPLIHVAWSDGVTLAERAQVLRAIEAGGVQPGSRAHHLCETLLEEPPGATYIAESRAVLRELLSRHAKAPMSAEQLLEQCIAVAETSGGLMGLRRPISAAERETLREIAAVLGPRAEQRLAELTEDK